MFNDIYGLTQEVLEGRKTMTRRIVNITQHQYELLCGLHPNAPKNLIESIIADKTRYAIGEVVAIAQRYADCGNMPDYDIDENGHPIMPRRSGFFNKMFVRADLMPHQIRITGIRAERLQDISEEDCMKEGIRYIPDIDKYYFERTDRDEGFYFENPLTAFAALIDKVSGKGTWDKNPYVFVYEFELVN